MVSMCGRYVLARSSDAVAAQFGATHASGSVLAPHFNIPPTSTVPVIIAVDGERRLGTMSWGIRGERQGKQTLLFNSRLETLVNAPSRRGVPSRRCLVPATGYYEWHTTSGVRTPYFITDPAAETFAMAGLYDGRKHIDGHLEWSFSIVTTAATPDLVAIHHRRPLLLPPGQQAAWLAGTAGLPDVLLELNGRQPPLTYVAVGPQVGDVRNNTASLLGPDHDS